MPRDIYGKELTGTQVAQKGISDIMKSTGQSQVAIGDQGVQFSRSAEDTKRENTLRANELINSYDEDRWERGKKEGTHDFLRSVDEKGTVDPKAFKDYQAKGEVTPKNAQITESGDLVIDFEDGSQKIVSREERAAYGKIRQKFSAAEKPGREKPPR